MMMMDAFSKGMRMVEAVAATRGSSAVWSTVSGCAVGCALVLCHHRETAKCRRCSTRLGLLPVRSEVLVNEGVAELMWVVYIRVSHYHL